MPDQLERLYRAVPAGFERWKPPSWDGIPGETFTALEQVCPRTGDVEGLCSVRAHRARKRSGPDTSWTGTDREKWLLGGLGVRRGEYRWSMTSPWSEVALPERAL